MGEPTFYSLAKPEEAVRSPEMVDDSKLIGILDTIDRLQTGEIDSVTLADTLDTFAAIIRQILTGESVTGSYLRYPAKNLRQIADELDAIRDDVNTITLTAAETIAQFKFVRLSGNNAMALALADTSLNSKTLGCLLDTQKINGESGRVGITGRTVTGILTGASFGDRYFLSTTNPGAITTVVPTLGVQLEVGMALNTTDLLLHVKMPFIRK